MDEGQGADHSFHLAQLDAVAHMLDLIIPSGHKHKLSMFIVPAHVPGSVNNLRISCIQGILDKGLRRFFRIIVIAQCHGGPPDADFSLPGLPVLPVQKQNLRIGEGLADGNGLLL